MTEQTNGTDAKAAQESRALKQQRAIEERFGGLLHGRCLNVGSGSAPMVGAGWENVDMCPAPRVDHNFDLRKLWPLEDDTYDAVTAVHVLEHFTGEELFHIVWEAGRVLKRGGCLAVVVPYGLSSYHYSNPFHKQAWTEGTPLCFNRLRYEQENTQSTGANQGQRMRVWNVTHLTFLPTPDWINESKEAIVAAMKRYLNVINEMSFAMVLEDK